MHTFLKIKGLLFLSFLGAMGSLSAGAVTLVNDSSFPLFVEVLAADGSMLGRETLKPRESRKWSGGWAGSKVSQTPYTVRWFCQISGDEFALCGNVPTGASVSVLACDGVKYCKPPKKQEGEQKSPE